MARDNLLTAPLGQLPLGLLDFFSLKSMGEYPQRLGDQVLPHLDLFRWYADGNANTGVAVISGLPDTSFVDGQISGVDWAAAAGAFNFAGIGAGATIVPQGELWIVLEASTEWSISDVGGSCDAALVAVQSSTDTGTRFLITDGPLLGFTSGLAAITRGGMRCATKPFFLQPGQELRSRVFGVIDGAGTVNVRHSVRIRRLQR